MPTSENANWHPQHGLTLLEMLTALALIALASTGLSGLLVKSSPRVAINSATNQMVVDLKRARFEMTRSGETITIIFDDDGYTIQSLNIDRQWPSGVRALLKGPQENEIIFAPEARISGYEIVITKGGVNAQIDVAPITRRIARR